MDASPLFGERSLTLVAAIFPDRRAAAKAANSLFQLSKGLERWQVALIHPDDKGLSRKLQPESAGIARTLVRAHGILGFIGLLSGAALGLTAINSNWWAAASTPGLTLLAFSTFGALAGLLLGGAVALRPDHSAVADKVRQAVGGGKWAVVAHPLNRRQAAGLLATLRQEGGETLRSL